MVQNLILVKKIRLPPSTALVQKIITESLRFGGQGFFEDETLYLKIVSWPKFKHEIQFTHFLGYERQISPVHPGSIENFHAAQVFQLAGAIGLPAIFRDVPLPSPRPPQEDPPEKQELPSVPTTIATNPKHRNITSEVESLPPYSTSKAWYRENIFSSIPNLPTLIRAEQSTSRERERSQVISDVDRLCATLDTTTLEEQNTNSAPIDSGFKQNSCGSSNQTGGSGSSQLLDEREGQRSADSGKSNSNLKRKGNQRKKSGSGGESDGGSRKKTRGLAPEQNHWYKCRIYEKSNPPPRDKEPTYSYPTCDGKSFKNFYRMVEHLLRVHIRPVQCGRCPARFGRNSERNRHETDVCKKKGLVKRSTEDANNVPERVRKMGERILDCGDVGPLDSVLYRRTCSGDQKLYDLLDQTDALEEKPEHLTPGRKTLESGMSRVESCPVGEVSVDTHNRGFREHTGDLCFSRSSSDDFDGGPANFNIEHDLTRDLEANPDIGVMIQNIEKAEKIEKIEKIITGHTDAEKDPKHYKELMDILFHKLPTHLSNALVEHIHGVYNCISPHVLSEQTSEEVYVLGSYASQVGSGGDDFPVSSTPSSDSAYASNQTEEQSLQLVQQWCQNFLNNQEPGEWPTTHDESNLT